MQIELFVNFSVFIPMEWKANYRGDRTTTRQECKQTTQRL